MGLRNQKELPDPEMAFELCFQIMRVLFENNLVDKVPVNVRLFIYLQFKFFKSIFFLKVSLFVHFEHIFNLFVCYFFFFIEAVELPIIVFVSIFFE